MEGVCNCHLRNPRNCKLILETHPNLILLNCACIAAPADWFLIISKLLVNCIVLTQSDYQIIFNIFQIYFQDGNINEELKQCSFW